MNLCSAFACLALSVAVVGILTSLSLLVVRYGLRRKSLTPDSLARSILPSVACVTAALMADMALERPYGSWDDARFAATMAIAKGYRLYYPPDQGPVLNYIYGPLGPIMYLPAMLAGKPDEKLFLAGALAQVFFFAPIAVLCFGARRLPGDSDAPRQGPFNLLLFCGAVLVAAATPSLRYSAFSIHADAPALGLAAMACLLVAWAGASDPIATARRTPLYFLSIAFATGTVLAKQTTLPLLPALVICVGFLKGGKIAAAYLLATLVVSSSALWAAGAVFGGEAMWFNAWTIPAAHPWGVEGAGQTSKHKIMLLFHEFDKLIDDLIWVFLLFTFVLLCDSSLSRRDRSGPRRREVWARADWQVFLVTAAFMIPTACIGRAKIGGDVNSFSFVTYFILLATVALVGSRMIDARHQVVLAVGKILVVSLALCLAAKEGYDTLVSLSVKVPQPSPTARIYDYCRLHPGEVYFPWHPTAVLAAEGHLYHFAYGFFDRELAGFPLTAEHLHRHVPAGMLYLAIDRDFARDYLTKRFPEYSEGPLTLPGLEDFEVYKRKAMADDPSGVED